jgi:hypothetical protein
MLAEGLRGLLEGSGDGDLVLLLGAQGMDAAAAMARAVLGEP